MSWHLSVSSICLYRGNRDEGVIDRFVVDVQRCSHGVGSNQLRQRRTLLKPAGVSSRSSSEREREMSRSTIMAICLSDGPRRKSGHFSSCLASLVVGSTIESIIHRSFSHRSSHTITQLARIRPDQKQLRSVDSLLSGVSCQETI